jgi:hypothetical protein
MRRRAGLDLPQQTVQRLDMRGPAMPAFPQRNATSHTAPGRDSPRLPDLNMPRHTATRRTKAASP